MVIPLHSTKPQALAQITFNKSNSPSTYYSYVTLRFKVGPEGSTKNIFTLNVDPTSTGQTYRFDQTTHPDFSKAVELLTNGNNDNLWYSRTVEGGGGGESGSSERGWIEGGVTNNYDPDFTGSRIDHVLVHVDNVTFGPPLTYTYIANVRIVFMGYP